MRFGKTTICLILVTVVLNSCTKIIDFDVPKTERKLVIEAQVTNEFTQHVVLLKWSADYFSNSEAQTISNAKVIISDGQNDYEFSESATQQGKYLSVPFAGLAGKQYELIVTYNNIIYTAKETLPLGAKLDSVAIKQEFKNVPFSQEVDSSYTLYVWGQEAPGEKNYYMWKLRVNSLPSFTDTLKNIFFLDDTGIDGAYIPGYPVYTLDHKSLRSGDTLTVYGYAITRGYYDFMRGVLLETAWRGDNPWDGPPANIGTNIVGNAVGYFNASYVSSKKIIVP